MKGAGALSHYLRYHRDGDEFVIRRIPWWVYALVEVEYLVDTALGHRFCNSRIAHWVALLENRRAQDFRIPVSRTQANDIADWLWKR